MLGYLIVKFCYIDREIYWNIYSDNNSQPLNLDANLICKYFCKGFLFNRQESFPE